ncbi:hypothetical protein SAMN05421690_104413 [Nitrosomonas sp. Nm51]|nr:hypothetical protein SAMN05421690_104413 [Nitrosomonas sp. Nm51]
MLPIIAWQHLAMIFCFKLNARIISILDPFWCSILMQENWRNFLQTQHAVIENDQVAHFGNLVTELKHAQTGTILVDLSHYGLLGISGVDAKMFLQNQLSCDVNAVNIHRAQYGSYCTPKGRVLVNFMVMQNDCDWLLQFPIDLCASIQKRLSMFVLRSKVEIKDRSRQWVRIGVAGKQAETLAKTVAGTAKRDFDDARALSVVHSAQTSIVRHASDRYEIITTEKSAHALWRLLSAGACPAGAACWRWREIHDGIPVVTAATQEQFLPQMINLDLIGGVSFKKGCYPGQEIVARTQYLGKLKRRMYLARIETAEVVNEGDDVFCAETQNQSCGTVVNAAPSPQGGYDVLAVIQQSSVAAGGLCWQEPGGLELGIGTLPYSLE